MMSISIISHYLGSRNLVSGFPQMAHIDEHPCLTFSCCTCGTGLARVARLHPQFHFSRENVRVVIVDLVEGFCCFPSRYHCEYWWDFVAGLIYTLQYLLFFQITLRNVCKAIQ